MGDYTWNLRNLNTFVAVITFFPLSSVEIFFDTSLLLIVCALRWYVKSLYRHLFLEDISKHAWVTKKWHFLICGKHNSKAPWATRPKIGVWTLTPPPPPPPPELWWLEEVGSLLKLRGHPRNFCDPTSYSHHNSGGLHAACFSNPHTNFGARRSRRLGVRFVTN